MAENNSKRYSRARPHPWHGIEPHERSPELINVFIEITRFDIIKYEVDPRYGYLRVDRPQRNSSLPPSLYGMIPQTLAGPKVASFNPDADEGDGDALDVCVLSGHDIDRSEVLLTARVIGGISTTDQGKADEKIIAVLANDLHWGDAEDMGDVPSYLTDQLMHYFRNYKIEPKKENPVKVGKSYSADRAKKVIEASIADYKEAYD